MAPSEEDILIEKLRKIEALYARTDSAGERGAAGEARERILQRLRELERTEKAVEYRFTMVDGWSKSLFVALLQRYNLKPYRYRGQRRTTVMVKVTKSFVDEVLWPEFRQLSDTLDAHLESVTQRIIHEAIHRGDSEVEERPGNEPIGIAGQERG